MQEMSGSCGKKVAFVNSVVGKGHAENVKLEQRPEGGQRWCHADS